MAASAGVEAAVKLHIARGDDLECRDKRGFTPLMIAASRDRATVCRLLLQAGVNASSTDLSGKDALALARLTGSEGAATAILEHLAILSAKAPSDHGDATKPSEEALPRPVDPAPQSAASATTTDLSAEAVACLQSAEADVERADIDTPNEPRALSNAAPAMPAMSEPIATRLPDVATERHAQHPPDLSDKENTRQESGSEVAEDVFPGERPLSSMESLFGDWEPVEDSPPPPNDADLAKAETLKQQLIDRHVPIDSAADWADFEAELPEFAKPLPRADNAEFRAELRRVLLLAIREGSVPRVAVENLLSERGDAEARDREAEAQLQTVIGDIGAEIDERLEVEVGSEDFEIFVDCEETLAEEREVDDAVEFFQALRSGNTDPLRIYLKSIPNQALLTAKEEADIAKSMEASVVRALEALSLWSAGLTGLQDAVRRAIASPTLISAIVVIGQGEVGDGSEAADSLDDDGQAASHDLDEKESDRSSEDGDANAFAEAPGSAADALEALAAICELVDTGAIQNSLSIRERLGTLRFRRPFLVRLAGHAPADRSNEAKEYRSAIEDLLASRNEMAIANLRLVYATAKRYLYSGLPLDDLIQEGNVGLLKAIDRFDWRRGFKFSTMAVWWIKQQIGRAIPDTGFSIRPPVHLYEKTTKLYHACEAFERANGRMPTAAECAALLGVSIQRMEMLTRPSSQALSFDDPEVCDEMAPDVARDPSDIAADKEIARVLSDRLALLDRKPEVIVRMRTGIGGGDAQTLEQIGNSLDVTRERIRQIEAKAMRALSSVSSREALALATGRPVPRRVAPRPPSPSKDLSNKQGSNELPDVDD